MSWRMIYDIHTHTNHSHATGTVEENVRAAVEKGLFTIGISEHGYGHVSYGASRESFDLMRAEVDRLRPLYPQIEILLGVEANIVNRAGAIDILPEDLDKFDYLLAGYHYGAFGAMPMAAVKTYIINLFSTLGPGKKAANTRMIANGVRNNHLKILTHPGAKMKIDIREVARACGETGTLMEISNRYDALSIEDIRICAEENVSFVISSDAHTPDAVGGFEAGLERALAAGLDPARIVNLEKLP